MAQLLRWFRSKAGLFFLVLLCLLSVQAVSGFLKPNKPPIFRFHLLGEPMDLDPAHLSGASGSYLLYNLYRSLYRYRPGMGLVPDGAKACHWQGPLKLTCYLEKNRQWSDGTPITAQQYLQAFRRLVDPETKTVQTELLLSLKNAKQILRGKKQPHSLGVSVPAPYTLVFTLAEPDSDFLYRLASPALAPLHSLPYKAKALAQQGAFNGPYKIAAWGNRGRIRLEPNQHYPGSKKRPVVEVLLVDDDTTALRLYETGHLNLLRRLPTIFIDTYQRRKDFFQVPLARFDYLGFGPELKSLPLLRKALSLSLDYDKLKLLYHALGRPGCPSLPQAFLEKPSCYPFQPSKARELAARQTVPELADSQIGFSKMGGDDIQRGMEWLQGQWAQNLEWGFQLDGSEQGMYLHRLRSKPPLIFRKGISLDRPTCLAALEIFGKNHRENYIRYQDPQYDHILKQLRRANSPKQRKRLCQMGVDRLMADYALIPLGEIHFSMLQDGRFKGWEINELNQLDLTFLEPSQP